MRQKLLFLTLCIICIVSLGIVFRHLQSDSVIKRPTFEIIATPDLHELGNTITEFIYAKQRKDHKYDFRVRYLSSTEILQTLQQEDLLQNPDIVLMPSIEWLQLSAATRLALEIKQIMFSPIVVAFNKDKGKPFQDGFYRTLKAETFFEETLKGGLKYAFLTPTHHPVGLSTYLGVLKLAEKKGTEKNPLELRKSLKRFIANAAFISPNPLDFRGVFEDPNYDAVIVTERMAARFNKKMRQEGLIPRDVLYFTQAPYGISAQLAYLHKGDKERQKLVRDIKRYLTGKTAQKRLAGAFFRTPFGKYYDSENWRGLSPLQKASTRSGLNKFQLNRFLERYQEFLRKPSYAVFVLNAEMGLRDSFSAELKEAFAGIAKNEEEKFWLTPKNEDVLHLIVADGGSPKNSVIEVGDKSKVSDALHLMQKSKIKSKSKGLQTDRAVTGAPSGGGRAITQALKEVCAAEAKFNRSVIVITDTPITKGDGIQDLIDEYEKCADKISLFVIRLDNKGSKQEVLPQELKVQREYVDFQNITSVMENLRGYL